MRRFVLVSTVVAALAAPATALGGGMAVWAMSGPAPDIKAGDVWLAQLRDVGCIGNPIDAAPTLTVVSKSGELLSFRGRRTGVAGKYTARVVFPSSGRWSYRVTLNGWGEQAHGPFVVAPAQKPSRLLAALPPVGAVLLVLGTGALLRRRRS
jgi:hypothetical protein